MPRVLRHLLVAPHRSRRLSGSGSMRASGEAHPEWVDDLAGSETPEQVSRQVPCTAATRRAAGSFAIARFYGCS